MKKLLSSLVVIAALSFISCNNEKKGDKAETTTDSPQNADEAAKSTDAQTASMVTAHACAADCKDGNHVYAHNEVGHTCTEACGSVHTCAADCKDGQHMYAHGESGHTCTEECTKM